MKAIIPAAGIGKRLRPHTHSLPKALLYVAGRPIISHILDEVTKLDISSVVLIVGSSTSFTPSALCSDWIIFARSV